MPQDLLTRLQAYKNTIPLSGKLQAEGRLVRLIGMTLEAIGCQSPVGTLCHVESDYGDKIEAEIIGFDENKTILMCTSHTQGLSPGAKIISTGMVSEVPIGQALIGRVIDGAGKPLDGKGTIMHEGFYPLISTPINPLQREMITEKLDVGIRAINSLMTIGRGQRIGLFAGSGVGKSVLLSMMTRFTDADIIVVGLVGERGREVKDFIVNNLGESGLKRSVVIASPADQSPLMRLHGAMAATSIAEYFRDQGKHVLLLMDSLTRFAQAQREIGLSVGEPPATKGYPPSVFSKLPQLVERAGNSDSGKGSITAFYTVLVEGDDTNDPIADSARAILDGHIVLTRDLAEKGHYPAIDVSASLSRVMQEIATKQHFKSMQEFKRLYSAYEKNKDFINIGAYVSGSDPIIDKAIKNLPLFESFLCQGLSEKSSITDSISEFDQLMNLVNAS